MQANEEHLDSRQYRPQLNRKFVNRVLKERERAKRAAAITKANSEIHIAVEAAREAIRKAKAEAEAKKLEGRVEVKEIIAHVAALHAMTPADLTGKSRVKAVMEARVEAVLAIQELRPDLSSVQVGKAFGGRDHTSILHIWWKYGNKPKRSSPKQEGQPR